MAQYLHWFADMEARLAESQATAVTLIKKAEKNWLRLEDENIFMDEPRNNGQWLRPWLQSCVEFKQ